MCVGAWQTALPSKLQIEHREKEDLARPSWLSGLSVQGTCPGSGQVPSWGCAKGNPEMFLIPLSFSLPLPLSKNNGKSFKKKKGLKETKLGYSIRGLAWLALEGAPVWYLKS